MPAFFSGSAGRVAAVALDDGAIPLGVIFGDFKNYVAMKGLLTSLTFDAQSGVQVRHSLKRKAWIYAFSERVHQIRVGGLAFVSSCDDKTDFFSRTFGNRTGLERAFRWYEHNRLSTSGVPVMLTLTPFLVVPAYVIKFSYSMIEPSSSMGQFMMEILAPPRHLTPSDATAEKKFDDAIRINIGNPDDNVGGGAGGAGGGGNDAGGGGGGTNGGNLNDGGGQSPGFDPPQPTPLPPQNGQDQLFIGIDPDVGTGGNNASVGGGGDVTGGGSLNVSLN